MAALVCQGHLLIEGLPGLGKTKSVSTIGSLCDLKYGRIQFTPDLLPSDLIGTMIFNHQNNEFATKFGPIFTQLLLADEINRAPAKVQSALLEAMAERQVTIGEESHKLTSPFVVLATQNPIEQEGTYALPEAQLDRFMMKVNVGYPDFDSEIKILDIVMNEKELSPILTTDDLIDMQQQVDTIYLDDKIKKIIVRLVQSTRPGSEFFDKKFKDVISAGVSPRASIWLMKLAKFDAFVNGKEFVSPENVFAYLSGVLGHRLILSYESQMEGETGAALSKMIAETIF